MCRDRAGAYAEGAAAGAPEAIQVADRFHLWMNLGQAVEKCVAAHRSCLSAPPSAPAPPASAQPSPRPATAHGNGRLAARLRAHHALVHSLLGQGMGIRAIARHLGWGRHTVQRYARAEHWHEVSPGRHRRGSSLDVHQRIPTHRRDPRPHLAHRPAPRTRRPRLAGQLLHAARLGAAPPSSAPSDPTATPGTPDRAAGHRLAHPPAELALRGRTPAAQSGSGRLPRVGHRAPTRP
ncbi:hypothetical protein ABZY09_49140 [Streptomyces sp. NPDC002928]|uniref:hypothetical protein n=1 Tax=Streptomyces sp. NPDC002928 TaxID=3154440 RepID=UPI0033B4298B